MGEWIRLIAGMVFITAGVVFAAIGVIGTYRFKYVLSRMHAAAMADTCGLLFAIIGLVELEGFTFTTLKLALIVVFVWSSSPVSSHLISSLTSLTHSGDVTKICELVDLTRVEGKPSNKGK